MDILIVTSESRDDGKRRNNVFITGESTLAGELVNTCLLLGLIIHVSIPLFAHVALCKCQQMNIHFNMCMSLSIWHYACYRI